MAKASSRKVARAAGIGGGRTNRGRTPWVYFGILGLIVVLGLAATISSRDKRLSQINAQGSTGAPAVGSVQFEGYGVYICGKFVAAITHPKDPQGITTGNGDGVIRIAPKVKAAAGKNATLGKFADAVGMTLNAAAIKVPGGKLYSDGDKCSGKASHVYVKQFADSADTVGQLLKSDPRKVHLEPLDMLVIAFGPSSTSGSIPAPPAYVITNLNKLAATATATPTTTTPATISSTTVPTPSTTSTTIASTTSTTK